MEMHFSIMNLMNGWVSTKIIKIIGDIGRSTLVSPNGAALRIVFGGSHDHSIKLC